MAEVKADKVLESIVNKQPFTFSPDKDGTYQAFKKEYQALGEKTKASTLGDVGALTGGNVADYAQMAAQQAQNTYMQQMGTILPALEEAAYRRYLGQAQQQQSNYGLLKSKEDTSYGRKRDSVADKQFKTEANWNRSTWNKDFNYGKKRDKVSDKQWKSEFGWQKKMDTREYELKKKQLAEQRRRAAARDVSQYYAGNGGSGNGSNFNRVYNQANAKAQKSAAYGVMGSVFGAGSPAIMAGLYLMDAARNGYKNSKNKK